MTMKSEKLAWVGSVVDQFVWAGDGAVFHPKLGRGDKASHCCANSRNSTGQDQLGSWSQALTYTDSFQLGEELTQHLSRTDQKHGAHQLVLKNSVLCFLCCKQEKETQTTPTLSLHRKSS